MTRLAVLLAAALLTSAACSKAPAPEAARARGSEAASWLFATRGVLLSWVDGKISAEAADKNLEATLEMLRRESASAAGDAKLVEQLTKAQTLLETARRGVKSDDKAAVIDATAALSDVRYKLEP